MKTLDLVETQQVAGGLEAVGVLAALTFLNLGLAYYHNNQINMIKSVMAFDENILDFVYNWTVYHEAQLSQLPSYNEVSALTFDQAAELAMQR